MGNAFVRFLQDQSGVTAIEYAVISFCISLALVAATESAGLHVALTLRRAAALMIKGPPQLTP
ncbi:MAG TPA: Flp family type IVb pilin [Rhizomicrobium sp.]|nr:Flp family type IVb pilin [Rhizomicrobium sp.]